MHWLCHLPNFRFQNGRKCPKLPDRPPPKSCPGLHSATTGPITTIQTPLESSRAVGVHWLCHLPNFRFQNGRKCPKLPDRPPPKSCPGLHSATTGPIIPIQTPLECSRAVGVHWLCHLSDFRFQNGRKCPNLGKCGIFWASLLLARRSLTACLPLHRHSTSLPLRSVTACSPLQLGTPRAYILFPTAGRRTLSSVCLSMSVTFHNIASQKVAKGRKKEKLVTYIHTLS